MAEDLPEKAIQAQVIRFYRQVGAQTYALSQYRRSRVAVGIPDVLVLHPRLGVFFHETKRPKSKQSPAQRAFQQACDAAGADYVVGGLPEAIAYLERRGLIERGPA